MSHGAPQRTLDIFARRVLAKAELFQMLEIFQEEYSDGIPPQPTGVKLPLTLYIVNHGAEESSETPNTGYGSPVTCVTLCKRVLCKEPENTMLCLQKSKVALNCELIFVVQYADDSFELLTLPKDLAAFTQYSSNTKAFVDATVLDVSGTPVIQNQSETPPYEQLVIKCDGTPTNYDSFEYTVTVPLGSFDNALRKCELADPTLQSYIVLRNLSYEADILDQYLARAGAETTIWTTMVDCSLTEDIIDKLGIDQDIQIRGIPEYVCQDD